MDLKILKMIFTTADSGPLDFVMEVTDKTKADVKVCISSMISIKIPDKYLQS